MKDCALSTILIALAGLVLVAVLAIPFYVWPRYSIWQREMAGRAELANAEWTKRIKVEEAKADLDSAKLKSESEVERARGVAEANKIIGDSLKGNDSYLRYLW